MSLIKDILPHIAALNQLNATKDAANPNNINMPRLRPIFEVFNKKLEQLNNKEESVNNINPANDTTPPNEMPTTSNHYCIVESEHPYRSASINCYRVEFPPCVQWLTIEFDSQCGTAQLEDYLLVSLPVRPVVNTETPSNHDDYYDILDNNVKTNRGMQSKNANLMTACYKLPTEKNTQNKNEPDWFVVKKFNT